jgi:hypothetical protein
MGSQENIRIFYEIPSTNTEKDKKRKADVNIGVELLVKKFRFKNIVNGNNGTLIRPVNDGLLESTEDDGVVRVDEAVIQSQVQKVRGVLGKPSSTSLRGNAEIAVWKFKDGSYIEVDDRETRIYYMDKNRGVIDVYLTANKMKTALFQSGLLESTEDLME